MTQAIYDRIGGEAGVKRLVKRFYELMQLLPEARKIREMHPEDIGISEEKLFLSGWMGGPPLYVEKHGHPMLRKRHFPFAIGDDERDQWMACMKRALEDVGIEEPLRGELRGAFQRVADHMRNA